MMKYELKDFQERAVDTLTKQLVQADDMYKNYNDKISCSLSAVTGSGKTVMAAAAIEALLNGSEDFNVEPHQNAVILWVTDSPALNDQTFNKFQQSSDMDVLMMHTVENTTTEEIRELQPHSIYFLNRQKLADSSLLTRGGEIPTFWQILQNTYDRGTTVYMMLDEAHRGLGKTSSREEKKRQTIYSKLIDGFTEGNFTLEPMPIVVGISATIKRFEDAMADRQKRTVLSEVSVSPADVQASGLLKDTIVISVPTADDAVQGIYLTNACHTLQESTKQWEIWCKANDVPENDVVHPLMVIQVKDKVKEQELRELCVEISEKIPWIDQHKSFANVFGDQASYYIGGIDIPYIQPELVQNSSEITVLFAKEAISTGWDCPRAEVIYSLRPHSDDTYIAQLIGRMVRTPLARRIDVDTLNSVTCFLPYFDRDTVQKVVDHLTKDKDDDNAVSTEDGRNVLLHPVEVEWDNSLQVDNAFESIMTRRRSSKQRNFIRGALELSGLLMKYEIDLDAEEYVMKELMRELNDSINTFHDEYEQAIQSISKVESTDIQIKNLNATNIQTNEHTEDADAYAIDHARQKADHVFELSLTNRFFEQKHKSGLDSMTINTEIAAAGSVEGIVDHVTQRAKELVNEFQDKYESQIDNLSESAQHDFASKMFKNGIARDVSLVKPTKDLFDGDAHHKYAKHVLNNPKDHLAPIKLSTIENDVVNEELKHNAIAWYRNPGNGNSHTLSIMYQTSDGMKPFHPDFIFFEKIDEKVMPYIVDPHGTYLADSLEKLRGYVNYVKKFGNLYSRIWSLDEVDGQKRYLDLKDLATQKAIKSFDGLEVKELYKEKYSHNY